MFNLNNIIIMEVNMSCWRKQGCPFNSNNSLNYMKCKRSDYSVEECKEDNQEEWESRTQNSCIICGRDIPVGETQLITYIDGMCFNMCMCHEGSEEVKRLQPLIKKVVELFNENVRLRERLSNIRSQCTI
jgi:hypothetical protein